MISKKNKFFSLLIFYIIFAGYFWYLDKFEFQK
ncbi:hypothetical protein NIASO_11360 [Niabella soli DSM 19437]|uniref:Uncharacterized protein n=1 Tax=Niabella soli DSM 19437 TaxID=929713 RepID=W0F838_9BACT|nr:hypothetical protein NIASO_11360 [Niabella soli DSM 19437]